jgi:hypothetical protein
LGFFIDEGLDIKKEDVEWFEKELEEMGLYILNNNYFKELITLLKCFNNLTT